MKSYVFIKNAIIMTFTALILRSAGIFLKVWLANNIGSEGIGLYQLIFSVYTLVATFASSGVCTAVTRLVSENMDKGKNAIKAIMKKAGLLITIIAVISAFIVYFFSDFLAINFLKDERAALSLKILSFSLPFMGISSCIKGYFVARRKMSKPSFAQIFEQAVRIAVILIVLPKVTVLGLGLSTAIVLLADTIAEICSSLVLYFLYLKDKSKLHSSNGTLKGIYRQILKITLPISGGKYLTTLLRTVENLMVPIRLTLFNNDKALSLSQFGALRGMVIPIIFFPSSFLMSVSTMLIPEMSEAKAHNHNLTIRYKASKTVNLTICSSIFLSIVFLVCGNEIGNIVYHEKDVGFMIRFLAPIIPFMYLESVVDGLIKGLNQQKYSFWYNSADSILRIVIIWVLLPKSGIKGFLMLMVVSNIATCMLNFLRAKKVAKIKVDFLNSIIKPITASAVGGLLALPLKEILFAFGEKLYTISQIGVITICFFGIMYLLKGFSFQRIEKVPKKSLLNGRDS